MKKLFRRNAGAANRPPAKRVMSRKRSLPNRAARFMNTGTMIKNHIFLSISLEFSAGNLYICDVKQINSYNQ
jgi:hypothetical protein